MGLFQIRVSDWSIVAKFIEIFTVLKSYSSTPVCSASVFSKIIVWNDSWRDSWFESFEFGFWLVDELLDHLWLVWSVSVDEEVLFDDKREILLDKLLLFEWKLKTVISLVIQKQTSDWLTKVMILICKLTLCSFYGAFF